MPGAASEVEKRGDERVRNARVVYPMVAVDLTVIGPGMVLFWGSRIESCRGKVVLREINGSNENERRGDAR